MTKKALCILKDHLLSKETIESKTTDIIIPNPSTLFRKETFLLDRKDCETDQDYLQIIPYVTLVDKQTKDIFIYKRGKASNETRLIGEYSLGLGGHIEEEPDNENTLKDTIAKGTMRELTEEVGLTTEDYMDNIVYKYATENFGCIHCRDNEVGKVHIGLTMFLMIDKKHITSTEKDVVCNGQWLSIDNIKKLTEAKEISLESWSRLVFNLIVSEMK